MSDPTEAAKMRDHASSEAPRALQVACAACQQSLETRRRNQRFCSAACRFKFHGTPKQRLVERVRLLEERVTALERQGGSH